MASIWKQSVTTDRINQMAQGTIGEHIGIEFVEIGDDYLVARMPVDERTFQPMRILHGGASVVLAETLGSVASVLSIADLSQQAAVGVEINANHLRAVRSGWVYGKVTPVRVGRTLHVWNIELHDEKNHLTCTSRITIMIIDQKQTLSQP